MPTLVNGLNVVPNLNLELSHDATIPMKKAPTKKVAAVKTEKRFKSKRHQRLANDKARRLKKKAEASSSQVAQTAVITVSSNSVRSRRTEKPTKQIRQTTYGEPSLNITAQNNPEDDESSSFNASDNECFTPKTKRLRITKQTTQRRQTTVGEPSLHITLRKSKTAVPVEASEETIHNPEDEESCLFNAAENKGFTPEIKRLLTALDMKMKNASQSTRVKMFSTMKRSYRKYEVKSASSTKGSLSELVIEQISFHYHRPDHGGVLKEWMRRSRTDHAAAIGNTTFNEEKSALHARQCAVREIVNALFKSKDEDQVALSLLYFMNHPRVKPFLGRIWNTYHSEAVQVGLHAFKGMESIVRIISDGRINGGRTRQCRSLLKIIGMCLAEGLGNDDCKISKNALYRTVFKSISIMAARRLMVTAGKKMELLGAEELQEFRCVEVEAKRWKYNEYDFVELRKYMCDNRYTKDSPNVKDTVNARDIYGKLSIIIFSHVDICN